MTLEQTIAQPSGLSLDEMIAKIKAENPTLRRGSEETGYEQLDDDEYEAIIAEWANNRLEKEAKLLQAQSKRQAALAKLAALGLEEDDIKALGL